MELTGEQLLGVFAEYNVMIWPIQIVAYLLGVIGLLLSIKKNNFSKRLIPAILAFFWLWVGLAFWLPSGRQGFAPGYIFAAIFLIQGMLFLYLTVKPKLAFGYQANLSSWAGIFFVLYALIGYPLFGRLIGHVYPYTSPFGLTPCPVVAYTFGLFLLTVNKVSKSLLIIPFCYSLSGFLWISIGMVEDVGMIASGLFGVGLIWAKAARQAATHLSEDTSVVGKAGWSLDVTDKK
jgi:hypothetical protein